MGFYATEIHAARREETHPPSKNRVWVFLTTSPAHARQSAPQPLEPHQENPPTPTATASGVRFYGYRYLNPELGRWINRDPIGERGGVNIYSAFLNEGLSLIDPYGLEAKSCCTQVSVDEAARAAIMIALGRSDINNVEYCGLICCDPASGEVMYTGPHRGWVSRKIASMCPHTRKPIPEYQHTCSPAYALRSDESDGMYSPCPDDLVTVGDYHTHPTSGPTPGSGDHEWAAGRRYNPRCGSGSYVGALDHETFCRYGQNPADNIHLPLVPESRAEGESVQ